VKKDENQIESELSNFNEIEEILDALVSHFAHKHSKLIQKKQLLEALFLLLEEKHNLEWAGDLWDIKIEYDKVLTLLSNFDFRTVFYKIETPKEIIPKEFLMEFKVRIKSKGIVWAIHKNDSDQFPSNPHAHQIDNNIKLDLSNGNCYKVRKYITTIRKKDLLLIREAASKVFEGNLPPLSI
jgi:hypothetical protein